MQVEHEYDHDADPNLSTLDPVPYMYIYYLTHI